MRRAVIIAAGILVSGGLLAYVPLSSAAVQGTGLATSDGYGVSECLTGNESCGKLVATTWCRANGYDRAVSIKNVDPGDAATTDGILVAGEDGRAVVIACGA